jgi:hypothetical protein
VTPFRSLATLVIVALAAMTSCGPSADEEAADLCRDLGSLRATFHLVLAPPTGATVGQVRGAVEKVAPILTRAAGTQETAEALDERIDDTVEAFRDGLDDLGDDEPASAADPRLAAVRPRLADAVEDVAAALGCDDRGTRDASDAPRGTVSTV